MSAVGQSQGSSRRGVALRTLEHSQVDAFAPVQRASGLETVIESDGLDQNENGEAGALAMKVPQRKSLFLDEIAKIHIVLRAPFTDQSSFRSFLELIEISLETVAIGSPRPIHNRSDEQHQPPSRDLIDTQQVEDKDPEIAISDPSSTGDGQGPTRFVYALWRAEVHIARSRIRSFGPSVYFSVGFKIKGSSAEGLSSTVDEHLPSGVPTSINLLDAFKFDPRFDGNPPTLTLARLSKMTPVSGTSLEAGRPLRNPQRRLLRLVPAINTRIQFSRLGVSPTQAKALASLDVETSSFVNGDVKLEEISISLSDGRAEPLGTSDIMKFPVRCRPLDVLSYVYNLLPHNTNLSAERDRHVHAVSLRLMATLRCIDVSELEEDSSIPLKIQWRTPVDLSSLAQRQPFVPPHAAPVISGQLATPYSNHLITLTVSGPESVPVHGILRWNILLANRGRKRTLRLALIPVTTSNTLTSTEPASASAIGPGTSPAFDPSLGAQPIQSRRKHRHKPTLSASFFTSIAASAPDGSGSKTPAEPGAAADPQSSAAHDASDPGLIPITPDVRVGPLLPGESAEAQMQFLVLRPGVLRIDAIRIVDLEEKKGEEKKEFVDVRADMLPDIVAVVTEDGKEV